LDESWDTHAGAWIEWARRPGHDSYWRFHRERFLPLIPPPGRLTVDIGCGEGRVTRDVQALGHRVIGVDSSLAMARAAATHPSDPVNVVAADGTRLPFPNGAADCVVAFMALHDIDDMPGTVAEAARILVPGGRLVLAVVHPLNSAGRFVDTRFIIEDSWFRERPTVDVATRDGLTMTFHSRHRPLQAYTEALADAGLLIERLREPTDDRPDAKWSRMPMFLHIRAVKGL